MAIRPSHILRTVLLACAALGPVHAAELGEARVRSHIGQALAADVELTLVEDTSRPVEVRLAHPDVYRGANIAMPSVLSGLDIAVIRQGGKQFLHLTSSKPVESRHLHVYLEIVDGGQRAVRLVTLWFTPDPHPAPAPAPAPTPMVAAAPAVAEPPKASAATAKPVRAVPPARKPAPPKRRAAPVAADADAHDAQASAAALAPTAAVHEPKAPAGPVAAPASGKPDAHAGRPEAPAACAPQVADVQANTQATAQANACAVLGAKNDALRQELGQLEEKVKVLQVATGVKSAAEAAAQSVPKPDEKPKSAPRIHRKPKPAAPPEEPTPWLAIAGGIVALLALLGGVVLLRRRRGAAARVLTPAREPEVVVLPQDGGAAPAAAPRFMAAVKARLMALRRGKQASTEAPQTVDEKTIIQPE